MGKLIGQIIAAVAEMEWEMTRDRIRSGIQEAKREGKWAGRPPAGFTTDDDGYLVVKPEEYLRIAGAIDAVEQGDSMYAASKASGIPQQTLSDVYNDPNKRERFTRKRAADERVQEALESSDVDPGEVSEVAQLRKELEELEEAVNASNSSDDRVDVR